MKLAGRFAPSPTGPLHMGSLLTALASYLDIKQQRGDWFVRIDDLDPPRQDPTATTLILRSLTAHGLIGDRPVDYQSNHQTRYKQAFKRLENQLFYCNCTRRAMASLPIYPGTCREYSQPRPDCAVRVHAQGAPLTIADQLQGTHHYDPAEDFGDFIVKRRDDLWSYNFATAVDDGHDVTHVLRGVDLFHVTPQQVFVMSKLGLQTPNFCHLPVLCFVDGSKLSKQTHAPPLIDQHAAMNLHQAFVYLGMQPPQLNNWQPRQWLTWGLEHWDVAKVPSSLKPYEST